MKTKTTDEKKNKKQQEEEKTKNAIAISPNVENLDKLLDSRIAALFDQHNKIKMRHQQVIERKDALLRKHGGINVKPSDIVVLNVRGEEMFARRDTLTLIKDSRLEALFSGRWENQLHRDQKGRVFMDVDPGAFRRILEYLYMMKIAPPKERQDILSSSKGILTKTLSESNSSTEDKLYALYIDLFKLGLVKGEEGTLGSEVSTTTNLHQTMIQKKEVELLEDMKRELDAIEKKLETEESFVSMFTRKNGCVEYCVSIDDSLPMGSSSTTNDDLSTCSADKSWRSAILGPTTATSEDANHYSVANDEGTTFILHSSDDHDLINLYVNGEIFVRKFSAITADETSKLTQNLTNVEWSREHSITTEDGQKCVLMEYPRNEFKSLLNFIHIEKLTGLVDWSTSTTAVEDLLPERTSSSDFFDTLAKFIYPGNKNLHYLLPKNSLHESTIVTIRADREVIQQWLRGVNRHHSKPRLLYRASLHGNTARDFHTCCDGKGETITIIKTDRGCILGGYKHVPWGVSSQQVGEEKDTSFLFTLVVPNLPFIGSGIQQNVCKIDNTTPWKQQDTLNSLPYEGPVFGSQSKGKDLWMSYDDDGTCNVHIRLGYSYNYHPSSPNDSPYLTKYYVPCTDSSSWKRIKYHKVADYEVYRVD